MSNTYVTIYDRAENDIDRKREVMYNSVVMINLQPGEREKIVPLDLAIWMHKAPRRDCPIKTTDGEFITCRYGIKDPSPEAYNEIIEVLSESCFDCSPVERDLEASEGWESEDYAAQRGPTRVVNIQMSSMQRANQAAEGRVASGER